MHIPSHMMRNVQTLDIEAMKAAQDPAKTNELKAKLGGLVASAAMAQAHRAANPAEPFKPRANAAMKSLYASAKAGSINAFSFKTKEDAIKHASTIMMNLNTFADTINRSGGGDISLNGKFDSPFRAEDRK